MRMEVAIAGAGPAVLLVHGIPHTWFLWRRVIAALADRYFVIAPDLRGLGGTERARMGFDVTTVAGDLAGLLDVLGVASVAAVGIDLGVQTAFMLAMTSPGRVRCVALMEGLVGTLPGAESFLSRGAPWWFGFHGVPELPETLIAGHEAAYVDYFLAIGTYERRGVAPEAREAFVRAYSGRESIRCMCEHYRAMPESARQIASITSARRLDIPTLAIAGGVIDGALAGQLQGVAPHLATATIDNAAHILPEDQPETLLSLLEPFIEQRG
ncbi:alpha/beta fold hydrolase [Sorangium atrum]|uniref:Alpha/beta hydrolase n=1 Tax=Sorangium atrum TaxID=2995308 RepID=A0ABT5BTB8_9BACT|nr:alpha/beta hydrolase [Sorangium aterium]MDC0677409.1 alpha/beta hydrolase [Sorangium aterium]